MPTLAKLIEPGWGSKGYYSAMLLQEYGSTAFPRGTKMFINHPKTIQTESGTTFEDRDFNALAGVTTTDAFFMEEHPEGPGLYAWTELFDQQDQIKAKAKHSGLSIFVPGSYLIGEAEGRRGRIVQSLDHSPINSVDFVANEGAGGKLILSESNMSILEESFTENENEDDKPTKGFFVESSTTLAEANNVAEWVEAQMHKNMTHLIGNFFQDSTVNESERRNMDRALGQALQAFRSYLIANEPNLFTRATWQDAPTAEDLEAIVVNESFNLSFKENVTMNWEKLAQELKEKVGKLQGQLEENRGLLQEAHSQNQRLQEQLVLRDARDFAMSLLNKTDLPEPTKKRLLRESLRNPAIENGQLAKATFKESMTGLIQEARSELREIFEDSTGVWGMGSGGNDVFNESANAGTNNGEDELTAIFKEMGFDGEALNRATQ